MTDTDWVWSMPTVGEAWCTHGTDPLTGQPIHHVTKPVVTKAIMEKLGHIPERLDPPQLLAVTMHLWKFKEPTQSVAESLMLSVRAVTGETPADYDTATAMAIIRHFSSTWPGEPSA